MCARSGVPLLAMPSFASEPTHDGATDAFLLAQSLAARQQEEEAREQAEVEMMEETVASRMQRLEDEVMKHQGRDRTHAWVPIPLEFTMSLTILSEFLFAAASRHTTGILLCLPRKHDVIMLELFYVPGLNEAILVFVLVASGHTKGIVRDSGFLMFVRSTCPPCTRPSRLFCLWLRGDTRRAS